MATTAILVEVCLQTISSAVAAEAAGVDRIELCADLARGGVTPSAGLIRVVRARVGIPLHILIRPRGGSFVYDDSELDGMLHDIREVRRAGGDGVVLGALARDNTIDYERTARLAATARPLSVTFHRAIDRTPDLNAAAAILVELGIERILSSGGAETAIAGIPVLATLVRNHGTRISIMAGGSVRAGNALRVCRGTGVRELHLGPRHVEDEELDLSALDAALAELAKG